jgi:hypothetical protein
MVTEWKQPTPQRQVSSMSTQRTANLGTWLGYAGARCIRPNQPGYFGTCVPTSVFRQIFVNLLSNFIYRRFLTQLLARLVHGNIWQS